MSGTLFYGDFFNKMLHNDSILGLCLSVWEIIMRRWNHPVQRFPCSGTLGGVCGKSGSGISYTHIYLLITFKGSTVSEHYLRGTP